MLKKLWDDIKAFFLGLFSEAIKVEGKVVQLTDDAGKVLTRDVAAAYRKSGFVVKEVETTAFKVGRLLDDKRMFGVLWILLALTAPFFLHITVQTVTIATVLGFVLWMGVPLGDLVKFLPGLASQGILDLFTNKANQGDALRFFGIVFQVVAWVYLFSPFWNAPFQDDIFAFYGGAGVAMCLAAVWGDHAAVKAAAS